LLLVIHALSGCEYPFHPQGTVRQYNPDLAHNGYTLHNIIYSLDYLHKCLLVTDMNGRVVWSFLDSTSWTGMGLEPLGDAEVTAYGNILTLIGKHDQNAGVYEIDPSTNRVVWEYDEVMAHHDVDYLPDGNILFLSQYEIDPPGYPRLRADGIRIVDPSTNETVWDWRSEDHFSFDDYCSLCPRRDWLHANTVVFREEPEGDAVYINLRNLNRVCKIDVASGDVLWCLGDGGDFGAGLFSHAHDPEFLSNGNILLFDNGLHRGAGGDFSRAIEIAFDPDAGHAEIVWEYRGPTLFYSDVMGDADRLPNGNTLITDATNGRIVEVTEGQATVWEYELDPYHLIYKSERLDTWPIL
jgi:outer membrane protein assembly factor BamB